MAKLCRQAQRGREEVTCTNLENGVPEQGTSFFVFEPDITLTNRGRCGIIPHRFKITIRGEEVIIMIRKINIALWSFNGVALVFAIGIVLGRSGQ